MLCSEGVLFFKQKTAYEMRISDWSSDVCSSDLATRANNRKTLHWRRRLHQSRPIGDGSACDAASVIMRHPATPAPCGKGLAAPSVTPPADPGLLHCAGAVQPHRPARLGVRSLRCRSEARRVGKKSVSTCVARRSRLT